MITSIKTIFILSSLVLLTSCGFSYSEKPEFENKASDTLNTKKNNNEPNYLFGIPADSFNLVSGHIRPNGFLSTILLEHGISMKEIDQLVRNSGSVFDVKKNQGREKLYSFP